MTSNKTVRWTIRDAVDSADLFLNEAKRCAELGMGYAALMTAFPVVLAVGESIGQAAVIKNWSVRKSVELVYSHMTLDWFAAVEGYLPRMDFRVPERDEDFEPWRKNNEQAWAKYNEMLIDLLVNVRNGLVHALSLPISTSSGNVLGLPPLEVCLTDSKEAFWGEFSDRYRIAIIPRLLVEAMSAAIHKFDGIDLKPGYDTGREGETRSLTGIDWGATTAASGIKLPGTEQ